MHCSSLAWSVHRAPLEQIALGLEMAVLPSRLAGPASPREPPVDNSRGLIQRILTHAASGALTGAEWPRAHVAPGPRFARLSRSFWSELGLSRPLMRVANDRSFEIEMQWQAARYASLNRACGEVSGDPSSDADAPLAVGFGGRNSEEVENLGQWLQSGTICRL